jgi:hypothetical protein
MSSLRFAHVNSANKVQSSLCHGFCYCRHAAIILQKHTPQTCLFLQVLFLCVSLRSVKAQACGSKATIIFLFRLIIIFIFAPLQRSIAAWLYAPGFDIEKRNEYQTRAHVFYYFLLVNLIQFFPVF